MADFLTWHKLTQTEIDAVDITEGNIFFNTTNKEITVDDDGTRTHYGGTVTIDSALSTTSTNPVQNQAIGNIIGDTDISAIGDGTITDAIDTLNTAFEDTETEIDKIATTSTFAVPTTGWTAETGGYYATKTLTGATTSDIPHVSLRSATNYPTGDEIADSALIVSVIAGTDTVTFHATATPSATVNLEVRL